MQIKISKTNPPIIHPTHKNVKAVNNLELNVNIVPIINNNFFNTKNLYFLKHYSFFL